MLIYHRSPETKELMVAQVIHGAGSTSSDIYHTDFSSMSETHIEIVKRMKNDEIVITGNSSVVGNGRFKDNLFTDYTKIDSIHPDIFTPLNPSFKPGREELENKKNKSRLSFIGKIKKNRAEIIQKGISKEDLSILDTQDEKLEDEMELRIQKEFDVAVSKLKSYEEMGIIVKPTKIEDFDGNSLPLVSNLTDESEEPFIDSVNIKR